MNKKKIKWLLVGLSAIIYLVLPLKVQANEMNFSVRSIFPENQIDQSSSYYNLLVKPGDEEVIQMEITNDTDKDIVIAMSANSAITNDNGVVDYSMKDTKKDSSASFVFNEIAEVPDEVKIPKNSKKIVEATLKIPKKEFSGYILGGIYFEQKNDVSEADDEDASVTVKNNFSYIVGVLLSESAVSDLRPELDLNKIETTQINGVNAIIMNIQNKQPVMIPKLSIEAKIYYENQKEPSYQSKNEDLKMAPNTNFNYTVQLKNQAFVPGKYTVKIKANDGYRDWEWEKKFEITEETAKKFNETAVSIPPEENKSLPWIIIIPVVLVIIAAIGGLIYYFKRKAKQAEAEIQRLKKKNHTHKKKKVSPEK